MNKSDVCSRIKEVGIVPAIRVSSSEDARFAAETVIEGGIPIVEIILTVPGAVELIAHLARQYPTMVVGAGTVLDVDTANQCFNAGASFLTSPGFDFGIVEFAIQHHLAVFPGALTPTEVVAAWRLGSDFVKVFPCAGVGGDRYIKWLKTALPMVPLIAAGGVNQQTAANFILAGASAIGVGSDLIPTDAIELRQSKRIRELARRFLGFVREARERLEPAKPQAIV